MSTTVLNATLPVFVLILLGQCMKRAKFPGDAFWAPAEQLVYWFLFPCLLITTLAKAKFQTIAALPVATITVFSILAMTVLTGFFKRWLQTPGPSFTSVFQGSVRLNSYIGFSIVNALYGIEGMAAAAVVVATFVPLVNLLGIFLLVRYGNSARPTTARALVELIRNPLILACALGIALNLSNVGLPGALWNLFDLITRAALPLGLLTVGAALSFTTIRADSALIALSMVLKLIMLPMFALLGVYWWGLDGVSAFVVVVFLGLPTSTSAYILARQLGGNAALMANLIQAQTLGSLLTIPLLISVLL
jgi:malonate transporter